MKRMIVGILMTTMSIALIPLSSYAHVEVTPDSTTIGSTVLFSIAAPNEKDQPFTSLKLIVPKNVEDVTPTTISGWDIAVADETGGAHSITWSNGSVPKGQRIDFTFQAQAPATAGSIDWKAYQTYADGTVVSWDQTPTAADEANETGNPYSVTTVTNDLSGSSSNKASAGSGTNATLSIVISIAAFIVSVGSILVRKRK